MPLSFPYYYGHASEQYAFFRIPKLLITDSRFDSVSSDAKLLYGLLLDRMELSYRNGWVDDQNRVFIIFTVEEVMETLRCRSEKAVRLFAELDSKKGIGWTKAARTWKTGYHLCEKLCRRYILNKSKSNKTEI